MVRAKPNPTKELVLYNLISLLDLPRLRTLIRDLTRVKKIERSGAHGNALGSPALGAGLLLWDMVRVYMNHIPFPRRNWSR